MHPNLVKFRTPAVKQYQGIPVDAEGYKKLQQIFGVLFKDENRQETLSHIIYKVSDYLGDLEFHFDKETYQKANAASKDSTLSPVFSQRLFRYYFTLILLAKQQGRGPFVNFTLKDFIENWETSKSGELNDEINNFFYSLGSCDVYSPSKEAYLNGNGEYFRFINRSQVKTSNGIRTYACEIQDSVIGLTAQWLRGESMSAKTLNGGYVNYPSRYLTDDRISREEANFRHMLLNYKGGYEVKLFTIFSKWIRFSEKQLMRKMECYNRLVKYLDNAKSRNEIFEYEFKIPRLNSRNWREEWKVIITKGTKPLIKSKVQRLAKQKSV